MSDLQPTPLETALAARAEGRRLMAQGKTADAIAAYMRSLKLAPKEAITWFNLGNALLRVDQSDRALEAFRRAAALDSKIAPPLVNVATILQGRGDLAGAEAAYRQAIARDPTLAIAQRNLGLLLQQMGRHGEAIAQLRAAATLAPADADNWNALGVALRTAQQHEAALVAFDRAIAAAPQSGSASINASSLLLALGRPDRALEFATKAMACAESAAAFCNYGLALARLDRMSESESALKRGLERYPEDADLHANLSLTLLAQGKLAEGWQHYEWRWRSQLFRAARSPTKAPRWSGEDLRGKSLLVTTEQGLGDALMMARFLPALARQAARVAFLGLSYQLPLLSSVGGDVAFLSKLPNDAIFDYQISLMDLPMRLGIDRVEQIESAGPYLHAEPERVAQWRRRLVDLPRPWIGIAWRGNPQLDYDRARSLDFAQIAALLARLPGSVLSLQKSPAPVDREPMAASALIDWTAEMDRDGAFRDSAALAQSLDLVISVDSAVAHLAGALGRPLAVLLPRPAEFRWFAEREDSPWYPTARLFRQQRIGDWAQPLAALEAWIAGRGWEEASAAAPTTTAAAKPSYEEGARLAAEGQIEAASQYFRSLMAEKPEDGDLLNQLVYCLVNHNAAAKALGLAYAAIQARPKSLALYIGTAQALIACGAYEEALKFCDLGQRHDAQSPALHYWRGEAELALGRYATGWRNFEARLALSGFASNPDLPGRRWQGEPLNGKSLLLLAEGGFGDTIQFARYVPLLHGSGATVRLRAPKKLWRLLRHLPGLAGFDGEGSEFAPDFWAPMMSLPHLCRTDLAAIPTVTDLLGLEASRLDHWSAWMADLSRPRFGLCWRSGQGPQHLRVATRSLDLETAASICALRPACWVNLQADRSAAELAALGVDGAFLDPAGEYCDFAESAALIAHLDAVVTVDTAIAHLAGTLGCPTALLVPEPAGYRWMTKRDDSPWYPSLRLFRQERLGRWDEPVAALRRWLTAEDWRASDRRAWRRIAAVER